MTETGSYQYQGLHFDTLVTYAEQVMAMACIAAGLRDDMHAYELDAGSSVEQAVITYDGPAQWRSQVVDLAVAALTAQGIQVTDPDALRHLYGESVITLTSPAQPERPAPASDPQGVVAMLRAGGRTVRQLAAQIGCSTSSIYRWAHGACQPSARYAAALAQLAA